MSSTANLQIVCLKIAGKEERKGEREWIKNGMANLWNEENRRHKFKSNNNSNNNENNCVKLCV